MVTMPCWPSAKAINLPRVRDRVTALPTSAEAAVTPIASTSRGRTSASSWSNQTLQTSTSARLGFLCSRRLPRGSFLKCFTTLVT